MQVHLNILSWGGRHCVTVDYPQKQSVCRVMRSTCTKLLPLTRRLFGTEKLTATPFLLHQKDIARFIFSTFLGYRFSPPRSGCAHTHTHTHAKEEVGNAPGPGSTLVLSGLLTTALVLIIMVPVPMGAVSQGSRVFTYPAGTAMVTVGRRWSGPPPLLRLTFTLPFRAFRAFAVPVFPGPTAASSVVSVPTSSTGIINIAVPTSATTHPLTLSISVSFPASTTPRPCHPLPANTALSSPLSFPAPAPPHFWAWAVLFALASPVSTSTPAALAVRLCAHAALSFPFPLPALLHVTPALPFPASPLPFSTPASSLLLPLFFAGLSFPFLVLCFLFFPVLFLLYFLPLRLPASLPPFIWAPLFTLLPGFRLLVFLRLVAATLWPLLLLLFLWPRAWVLCAGAFAHRGARWFIRWIRRGTATFCAFFPFHFGPFFCLFRVKQVLFVSFFWYPTLFDRVLSPDFFFYFHILHFTLSLRRINTRYGLFTLAKWEHILWFWYRILQIFWDIRLFIWLVVWREKKGTERLPGEASLIKRCLQNNKMQCTSGQNIYFLLIIIKNSSTLRYTAVLKMIRHMLVTEKNTSWSAKRCLFFPFNSQKTGICTAEHATWCNNWWVSACKS